jgi:hypothetical protein
MCQAASMCAVTSAVKRSPARMEWAGTSCTVHWTGSWAKRPDEASSAIKAGVRLMPGIQQAWQECIQLFNLFDAYGNFSLPID